jgi:hypothetical protein
MVDFGTDVNRLWIPNSKGDFALVSQIDNALQAIYNRVTIKLDELLQLGYTNYGNQSNDLIGNTDIETTEQQIILYTQICLLQEPRIQDIISISCAYSLEVATVECSVLLIDEDTPNNLVFNIGGN